MTPSGDQPEAIRQLTEGVAAGRPIPDPPRRDRQREDVHDLQCHRERRQARPGHVAQQDPGRPALRASSSGSSRRTGSSSSSATTITTSRKPTSPPTDTYIAKDASINDEIDRLRLRATSALLSGDRNVIVVASVSCIYGIGAPEEWASQIVVVRKGEKLERNNLLRKLLNIFYTRNDFEFVRGTMRVRGDVVEVIPAYENEEALRVEFFGDDGRADLVHQPARRESPRRDRLRGHLPGKAFRHVEGNARAGATRASRRSWSERLAELRAAPASSSKPSGWSSGPGSTWR